jgi:hypothetical protein
MNKPRRTIIELSQLRPTQITVGMLQVKQKRLRLRSLERRPAELVDFILEHPIRVVLGPRERAYVIDHHHLARALIKEQFESAPMDVEDDFSSLTITNFWKKMQAADFVHPYDADGIQKTLNNIPKTLETLTDDPYRSLAGFVREAGGFSKVQTPYAEFLWANFYRSRIKKKILDKHFNKALKQALELAHHKDANSLPGFILKKQG